MLRTRAVTLSLSVLVAFSAVAADKAAPAPKPKTDKSIPSNEKHPVDPAIPAPTGTVIDLKIGAEKGLAYVARPKGEVKGGLLVLHEWWGLNDGVKHHADLLAEQGYLALAVDLYKGTVGKTPEEAGKLMKGLDEKWGDAIEAAGIAWLQGELKGKKLATIGWCMGGGQSLNASLHQPGDVAATVIYYGMPTLEVAALKTLKGPVLGIWANKDGWITPAVVEKFAAALKEAGVKYEGHAYDADHAFANPTGGRHNPAAAQEAWKLTLAFLAENLK